MIMSGGRSQSGVGGGGGLMGLTAASASSRIFVPLTRDSFQRGASAPRRRSASAAAAATHRSTTAAAAASRLDQVAAAAAAGCQDSNDRRSGGRAGGGGGGRIGSVHPSSTDVAIFLPGIRMFRRHRDNNNIASSSSSATAASSAAAAAHSRETTFYPDLEYIGFVSALCFLLLGVVLLFTGIVMTVTITAEFEPPVKGLCMFDRWFVCVCVCVWSWH